MYVQHFGLEHEPFSIAPDPRYLYLSEHHREALAHLLYGLGGGGGFVLLTGEIGAGKTTVCRCFLEQVPATCQVAYIFNPKLTVVELLASVCEEFGVAVPEPRPGSSAGPTVKSFIDPLNQFLLAAHAAGRNCVLVIDEAQQLSAEVLEQLRLLTNLETSERKLLQIILVGQPELRDMLGQPGLEQLAQRVIARYHLGPLDEVDTGLYLQHRLAVAGLKGANPLGPALVRRIYRLSKGVPRRINLLCDRALLGAYSQGRSEVDSKTLARAAHEIDGAPARPAAAGRPRSGARARHLALGAAVLGLSVLGVIAAGWRPAAPADPRLALAASAPLTRNPASSVLAREVTAVAPPASGSLMAGALPPRSPSSLKPDELMRVLRSQGMDEASAWRALAERWNLALGAGDPCTAAAAQRANCFKGVGGLALVRQVDRPGLIGLRIGDAAPVYVLLVGLDAQNASLQIGKDSWAVPLTDLAGWWRGDFASYWRVPSAGSGMPVQGQAGMTTWVTERLSGIGLPAPSGSATSPDKALRARLVAFQIAQGLDPDGLPGPLTVMALNRATGVAEPRLSARP